MANEPYPQHRFPFFSVIVVVVLLFAPFFGKPIHMDDIGFLSMAREFQKGESDLTAWNSSHPPLLSAYLHLLRSLANEHTELVLHAGYVVFPLIFALSAARFAVSLGLHPVLIALLLLGNIAVLPVGQTLMADLPMTALWMLGG